MESWLTFLTELTGNMVGYIWGPPSIILLVGTGLYVTIRMGFIQFRGFGHSIEITAGKYDDPSHPGEVSHFRALSTALSATVGVGNIAGVATAIAMGGPGAMFWMWVTALVGMATKFAECTLALKFREVSPTGEVSGGPMYTLKYALNMPVLATLFALFALIASFGIGNMVQANSAVDGLSHIFPMIKEQEYKIIAAVIMAISVGLVIVGGIQRIAHFASLFVPFMVVFYCGAAILILILNVDKIPAALFTIFNCALNPWAVGGAMIGEAIRYGVARGVFSNEAGLGSSPMAHSAARTDEPVREGLVALMEPFIDTIIVCSMTGLVLVITGVYGAGRPEGLTGASLSIYAFEQQLGYIGAWVVGFGLMLFAYSTIISWSYYGDRCAKFLFGEKAVLPYRIVYTILVGIGAAVPLELVWNFADIANMMMAFPNLISLILLAGLVKRLNDDYFNRHRATLLKK